MSAFSKIIVCFLAQQNFKNEFPGHESDIHGIERASPDDLQVKKEINILKPY
jgi:arginine/lysine/ornithine decarboxylase